MTGKTVELFTDADMTGMERRLRRWRTALALLAAAALAACVVMAALTRTANADRMELAVIAVSTVAGWVVIYCWIFVVTAQRRELAHAAMLRHDERERVEGTVTVTDERVVIRRSITARRAEVGDQEQDGRSVLVCESRAAALAASGAVAVYTVHGYVAAYEVTA